jgi:hypothetical protein
MLLKPGAAIDWHLCAAGTPAHDETAAVPQQPAAPDSGRDAGYGSWNEPALAERRPSLTAAARGVTPPGQVGTKKTALRSNQETEQKDQPERGNDRSMTTNSSDRGVHRFRTG